MKTCQSKIVFLLLILSLLFAPAFSSEAVAAPSVTLDQKTLVLDKGATGTLKAETTNWTGTVTWTSLDPNVATVTPSSDGKSCTVTAVGGGPARIVVQLDNNHNDVCDVTVNVPVTRVRIMDENGNARSSLDLYNTRDQRVILFAEAEPTGDTYQRATNPDVTWSWTPDTSDAKWPDGQITYPGDNQGGVQAVKGGRGTLTATSKDNENIAASCAVTIHDIRLTEETYTLHLRDGKSTTHTLTAEKSVASDNVTWTVSRTLGNFVDVDSTGTITGINPGVATVNATISDSTGNFQVIATCTVTVVVDVTDVSLDRSAITLVRAGTTATLAATITPTDATEKRVVWSSLDPVTHEASKAVTVSQTGTVTVTNDAKNEDKAIIRVETVDGHYSAECEVTVQIPDKPAGGIRITEPESNQITITSGSETDITAYVWPNDIDIQRIIWTCDSITNPPLVTFPNDDTTYVKTGLEDGYQTVTVKAANSTGQVTITAETADGGYIATCVVRVEAPKKVTGIAIDESDISVLIGQPRVINAVLTPEGATSKVFWSSSDPSIATVTREGMSTTITPVGDRTGPITVTARSEEGGFLATCAVNVTNNAVPATGLSLSASGRTVDNLTLEPDMPFAVTGSIYPSNTTDRYVHWESNDPKIVTVTPEYAAIGAAGVFTGISPGETTVVATAGNYVNGVFTPSEQCSPITVPVAISGITIIPNNVNPLPIGGNTTVVRTPYGNAKQVTGWDWSSNDHNIARINGVTGQVTAVAPGTAIITCKGGGYEASCQVNVRGEGAETVTAVLANGQMSFSGILNDLRESCKEMTYGGTLKYITRLTVSTSEGTLYDGYVAEPDTGAGVSSSRYYYVPNNQNLIPLISDLYFVPRLGFAGNATISYVGYTEANEPYVGYVIVPVPSPGDPNSVSVSYTSREGEPIRFQTVDFSEYCQRVTGRDIRHVSFILPSEQRGALQYNKLDDGLYESKVLESTQYHAIGSPSIGDVWFVPAKNYNGVFTIAFRGVDAAMNSLEGNVLIKVGSAVGANPTDVSYTVAAGQRVFLEATDFNEICRRVTGTRLDHIYFETLPDNRGTLYESDNSSYRAGIGILYYYSRSSYYNGTRRSIDNLSFQANASVSGTTSFNYTGVSDAGDFFTGMVRITVTSENYGEISYQVYSGQRVAFHAADFNQASLNATGADLEHIRFNGGLPSASRGVLSCAGTPVSSTENYFYIGRNASISSLAFTAANNYSGSFEIAFIGYNNRGRTFTGAVKITVVASKQQATPATTGNGALTYYSSGEPVMLRGEDFISASSSKLKYDLASVRLTPPDASVGRLCLDYNSPTSYTLITGTERIAPTELYRVSFQPKGGWSGTANIKFSGIDVTGKSFIGTLMVQVTPRTASQYFNDMSPYPWAVPAVDFLASNGVVTGTDDRTFSPTNLTKRCDFVLMLARAFAFPYAGYESFRDVEPSSYYSGAVAAAKGLGISTGDNFGMFQPDGRITRQDAAVLLYRTLRTQGTMPVGTSADLASFSDRNRIAGYAVEAMASLVRIGVLTGDNNRQLNPTAFLTRAELATIFYRAIT